MRIVVAGPTGEGHLGPSLADGLRAGGHDVHLVDDLGLSGGTRELQAARVAGSEPVEESDALAATLAAEIGALAPAAVVVLRGRFLTANGVAALRAAAGGGPVVQIGTDNQLFPRLREDAVLAAIPAYDLVTTFADGLVSELRALGARRALTLPFAVDARLFHPDPAAEPTHDVAFVGTWNSERAEHLMALADLRLVIAGGRWAREVADTPLAPHVLDRQRWGHEAAAVYHSARVGINVLDPSNRVSHNMRTFELPACGTATIATRTAFHERLYGRDGAVLADGPAEFSDAVRALLVDDARRATVAAAGLRAVASHTYAERAERLVEALRTARG